MFQLLTITILSLTFFISCSQNTDSDHRNKTIVQRDSVSMKTETHLAKLETQLKEKLMYETSPNKRNDWKTIKSQIGYSIQLPDYFYEASTLSSTIQYYHTKVDSTIILRLERSETISPNGLLNDYKLKLDRNQILYTDLKENWFVVKTEDEKTINYFKEVIRSKSKYTMSLTYPLKQKEFLSADAPIISKSFQ